MVKGWSHPEGLSPAEVVARDRLAEERRKRDALDQARRPKKPGDTSGYAEYGPSEVTSRSGGGG